MARKRTSWNELVFNSMSPARILLIVSILANVALGATLAYLYSRDGDLTVLNTSLSHVCSRDYSWLAGQSSVNISNLQQLCHIGGQ